MANYYASCRTNYFKVKDEAEFLAAMNLIPSIELIWDDGKHGLMGNDPDGAGWPSWIFKEEGEEEIDLVQIVSEHLVDGEVAIFMEAGHEKMRYIVGYAECINSKGERKSIGLNDIYVIAMELTDRPADITRAEY